MHGVLSPAHVGSRSRKPAASSSFAWGTQICISSPIASKLSGFLVAMLEVARSLVLDRNKGDVLEVVKERAINHKQDRARSAETIPVRSRRLCRLGALSSTASLGLSTHPAKIIPTVYSRTTCALSHFLDCRIAYVFL